MKELLRLSLWYFVAVFAIAFALGAIRVLWLVEVLGVRGAELAEMPVIALVCALAAYYFVSRNLSTLTATKAVIMGLLALVWMLTVEFTAVLALRGLSLSEYVDSRDPISGTVYIGALAWFALAPAFFYRLQNKPNR